MKEIQDFFTQRLEAVKSDFLKDLDAFTPDQQSSSPGGSARTPLDLAYEVAFVNNRMAARIRGDEVGPFPQGWMKAPEGYAAKAREEFAASMDAIISAWSSLPPNELLRPIQLPTEVTHPLDLMYLVCYHTGYHDGQLNYLQSFYGDEKIHW
ncbi:MAG: DinB family protein [Fimbriimonas sp.]